MNDKKDEKSAEIYRSAEQDANKCLQPRNEGRCHSLQLLPTDNTICNNEQNAKIYNNEEDAKIYNCSKCHNLQLLLRDATIQKDETANSLQLRCHKKSMQ